MAASQTEKPARYRLVKTSSQVFWPSTDTRCKHRSSHLLVWDAVLQAHPHWHCKTHLKQFWYVLWSFQDNLRGTGSLHFLVHILVPRSDAHAMLEDSISRYGRPFMKTDWLVCVLHWCVNRKCYGG